MHFLNLLVIRSFFLTIKCSTSIRHRQVVPCYRYSIRSVHYHLEVLHCDAAAMSQAIVQRDSTDRCLYRWTLTGQNNLSLNCKLKRPQRKLFRIDLATVCVHRNAHFSIVSKGLLGRVWEEDSRSEQSIGCVDAWSKTVRTIQSYVLKASRPMLFS